MPARLAPLVGHAAVRCDDGVADGALGLALERADDVAAEGHEAVDDAAVLWCVRYGDDTCDFHVVDCVKEEEK